VSAGFDIASGPRFRLSREDELRREPTAPARPTPRETLMPCSIV
jgi:hypothetical protein